MRLIDVDELEDLMTSDWFLENIAAKDGKSAIRRDFIKAFDSIETAYDVHLVVAKLEKQAYTTTDTVCGGRFEAIRLSSAIEIVRNGGKE